MVLIASICPFYVIEDIFAWWNELKEFFDSLAGVFTAESAVGEFMSLLAAFPDIALCTVTDLHALCRLTANAVNI